MGVYLRIYVDDLQATEAFNRTVLGLRAGMPDVLMILGTGG
jgi:hypothetical protein